MPQRVIEQDGVFSTAVRKQINENFADFYESYGSVPEYASTGAIPTYTDAVALGVVNDLLYQKLPDGTVSQVGGGGNPFDQDLNTTDAVEFLSLALDDGNGNMLIGEGAAPDECRSAVSYSTVIMPPRPCWTDLQKPCGVHLESHFDSGTIVVL